MRSADHLTRITQTGRAREAAQTVVDEINRELLAEIRAAARAGVPKQDIARAAGISRPTLNKWLEA